jgi:DNA segregation ATPase FtsK/SpoIIIE, S-DNA-T family
MAKQKNKKQIRSAKQAWGILLLGLALLLFLSIISYDVNDPVSLKGSNSILVNNWLGPLGAVMAYYLMQWTLGYPIAVLPLLLMLYGLSILRIMTTPNLSRSAFLLVLWAIIFSMYLAFPETMRQNGMLTEYYPSGLIGGWLASKLVIYLSNIGGLILLVVLSLLLFVVTIQIELAQLFQFLGKGLRRIYHRITYTLFGWQERWKESREKRQLRKKEKKREELQARLGHADVPSGEEGVWIPGQPQSNTSKTIPEIMVDEPLHESKYASDTEPAHAPEKQGGFQGTPDDVLKRQQPGTTAEDDAGVTGTQAEMDFEVKEEHTDVELDYDALVKDSIAKYKFPSIDLLHDPPQDVQSVTREELKSNADFLEAKLLDFGVKAKVVRVTAGPVITLYELQPAPGVKVSSIVNLSNDLALAMEARGIRIIAPIPGRAAVGIEIPNRQPQTVYLKSLLRSERFSKVDYELPLALGKTINGESYITDLTKMPHLLVAGSTGSGKSVGINTMIMSMLYAVNPGKVKFMMIDPKKLELSLYRDLRDHYLLWRPDLDEEVITRPSNAVSMLNSLVMEMERRYDQLKEVNARNIVEFNERMQDSSFSLKKVKTKQLPYLVVVVDELADLMMVAAREIEAPIARLAGMARAVGIHLIFATQRPSVDVITGVIKANFPSRIAYQMATKVDSRTVIDLNGAEQLLGNGDMLFLPPGSSKPVRLQNPFVSTKEIEAVIEHIRRQAKMPYYSLPQPVTTRLDGSGNMTAGGRDNMFEEARAIVVQHQKGSVSLLQRKLGIGYSRAARLMDELEEEGVVGPPDGSKAREVLITRQELSQLK